MDHLTPEQKPLDFSPLMDTAGTTETIGRDQQDMDADMEFTGLLQDFGEGFFDPDFHPAMSGLFRNSTDTDLVQ